MKIHLFFLMILLIPAIIFAQPCTVNNATGCVCKDASTDCFLLPNIKLSYDLLVDPSANPETPGLLRVSVSTPNVGHGPLRVIATNDLVCGVDTFFNSNMSVCPDGSTPSQLVKQRIYRKQGNTMTYEDRSAGTMTYHPTHNHSHFDDWGVYTLRVPDPNEPNPLNWTIVGDGAKLGFCLMDFGSCQFYNGQCRDDNNNIITTNTPNYGLGGGGYSCGVTNQGITVGWTDIYYHYLDGMFIDIPNNVCNGDYMIVVHVDPHNVLLEENEDDNIMVAPITLTRQMNCSSCTSLDLDINFDGTPHQTGWTITDSGGNMIASSGSYDTSLANSNLSASTACLPDGCYDLTFYDSANNGMCPFRSTASSSGTFITPGTIITPGTVVATLGTSVSPGLCGNYRLTDANGTVVASGGGSFGASQTNSFCVSGGVASVTQPDADWSTARNSTAVDLQVLPNLVKDEMTVIYSLEERTDAELHIIDINGKVLQQRIQNGTGIQQVRMNVSELKSGFYFMQLVSGDVVVTKKFVKQ